MLAPVDVSAVRHGRHPAGLNLGDCLTYAVSHLSAQPLLCLGGDFGKTDLQIVGA